MVNSNKRKIWKHFEVSLAKLFLCHLTFRRNNWVIDRHLTLPFEPVWSQNWQYCRHFSKSENLISVLAFSMADWWQSCIRMLIGTGSLCWFMIINVTEVTYLSKPPERGRRLFLVQSNWFLLGCSLKALWEFFCYVIKVPYIGHHIKISISIQSQSNQMQKSYSFQQNKLILKGKVYIISDRNLVETWMFTPQVHFGLILTLNLFVNQRMLVNNYYFILQV